MGTWHGSEVSHAEDLRVMTFNIRYLNTSDGEDVWANRRDAVAETIAAADVVGLQEVVVEQLDDLRERRREFDWYGVGRDDGQQAGEMTAIGWRTEMFAVHDRGTFWLSETPNEVGSRGWDAALPRVASWVHLQQRGSEREFLLVNTHFDHRGPEARRNSAVLIGKWITEQRGNKPAILTGDLNAQVSTPPLDALLGSADEAEAPLKDAREIAARRDPGPDSTWNGFQEIVPGRRIDFILFSGELTVASVETLNPKTSAGRFASDHLPVLAVFE